MRYITKTLNILLQLLQPNLVSSNKQDSKRSILYIVGLRNTAKNGVLYNNIQYLRKKYGKKEEEKDAEAAGL